MSEFVQKAYFGYFILKTKDVDTSWIPNIVCKMSINHLRRRMNVKRGRLKFDLFMIWRKPKNHHDYSYFCLDNWHDQSWSADVHIPMSRDMSKPVFYTWDAPNDLIRNLDLSKEKSIPFVSRLIAKNFLSAGTKVTFYRTRENELLPKNWYCVL